MKHKPHEIPRILVLGDISQSVWRDFSKGLSKYSQMHQGWVLYVNSPYYRNPNLKQINPDQIRKWNIHGIISNLTKPSKTREILSLGLPTIITDGIQKKAMGKYRVLHDNAMIAEMGAQHFLERKFWNFAYCGFDHMFWSKERGQAFAKTVKEAGYHLHLYQQPQIKSNYSWESEMPFLIEWLKTLPAPIGLMACNDDRAQHVLEACRIAKLNVPEDVAVLGVDNDDFICDLTQPSLTSICLNLESIGYQAAEILDRLMRGKSVPPQELLVQPTAIVVRQSTDILAIEDNQVKEAVRFIRLNATQAINVSDVANAISTTIRTLDRRFNKSLGRSVHSEIIRIRIEQACHMLVGTNLSISEIAFRLGYSELKHLTQAFKREKGIGPLAYRKTYGNI